MTPDTGLDLVTGAFSYTGSSIARLLLERGRRVRTLTFHPDRAHDLQGLVASAPYGFDDPAALCEMFDGVTTLYNTYWVRFDHDRATFAEAVANSRTLFSAARHAGVARIVHISIANPSLDSPLPYYRGKALVERALAESGAPYSIVRPTLVFGGDREVLINNIAWILRRLPVFALPGDGRYTVQPVHVHDLARICLQSANAGDDVIVDAAGTEAMSFAELVHSIRAAVASRSLILHVPPAVMAAASGALGVFVKDVVLTRDEIRGLMAGLLASRQPALGTIPFSRWLAENGKLIGRAYANELRRHFAAGAMAARPLDDLNDLAAITERPHASHP